MKKLFLFIYLAVLCLQVHGQSLNWFPVQNSMEKTWIGGSISKVYKPGANIGSSSTAALGFDLMIAGVYFGFGSNLAHAQENQYGAGNALSKEHNIQIITAGYGYTFYRSYLCNLDIFPYVVISQVRDFMEDRYYGYDEIMAVHNTVGAGMGLCYKEKHFGVVFKVSTNEFGVSFCYTLGYQNTQRKLTNGRIKYSHNE